TPGLALELEADDLGVVDDVAKTEHQSGSGGAGQLETGTKLAGRSEGVAVDDDDVGPESGHGRRKDLGPSGDGQLEAAVRALVAAGARLEERWHVDHADTRHVQPRNTMSEPRDHEDLGRRIGPPHGARDDHVAPRVTQAE